MRISFHGADRGVTGSCHLVECAGKRILVDCGMFQGGREIDEENARPFGFTPGGIDFLLLTHAHLDHCGRIPLLAKRGFKGEIICTAATAELAHLVLLDAARLEEEEARYQARRARQGKPNARPFEPLYTEREARHSFSLFGREAAYRKPLRLGPGIRATFIDAGHILGSAAILLELEEHGRRHRLLFSGDLGYAGRAILRDPENPPRADTVVIETTYGDRLHKPLQPSIEELYAAIDEAIGQGGNVIIPTFALERAQDILYYLREGIESHAVRRPGAVFLDSPMAISATRIFRHHPECFDAATLSLFRDGNDPFAVPGLRFTHTTTESIAINDFDAGAVIMAGSGMCTGGRVRHHLRHNLGKRRNAVVFVGFAAKGTLARRIIDGAKQVRIFGHEIPVRARIYTIGGFSAHADQAALLAWYRHTGHPKTTFLVHGEPRSMDAFADKLKGGRVEKPQLNQSFQLL